MRYLPLLLISVILFVASGCSSKTDPISQKIVQKQTEQNQNSDEDAFLDEFEEEMQIETKSDPFSSYNRVMTEFNDGLFEYVVSPVARGYKTVVHKEIRLSVGNFFHNILYPVRLINNLLQGKFQNSVEETGRFVVNTTVGIFGLFDPAKSYFELEAHEEDFGQTLGFYGVGTGPHIVLPFFGPSNLRDMVGLYPDSVIDPIEYHHHRGYNLTNSYGESLLVKIYGRLNYVSLHQGEYEKLKKDSLDLYPYLRDVYEQYREQKIKE